MRALVTGAAGFIGSHITDILIQDGVEVIAMDDLSGGRHENVSTQAIWVQGSVTDDALLKSLFEKYRFQYVYHLAAYAAEGLSHFIRYYNYQNNLLGSIQLINLSVLYKVRCFVFASSIAVYGKNQLPMTEDLTPQPEDPYGISKYAVELDLKAAQKQFGLDFIIFRPHNVYGERQNIWDKYRNVVGIFMNQGLAGRPFTIFGDGKQTRAFSYIEDVAPMMARSVFNEKAYGEVFNIGSDTVSTVIEVAGIVAKSIGVPLEIRYLPARNEVTHAFSSHEKIRRYFGASASVSLKEGIARMAAWAKNAKTIEPLKPSAAIEIEQGLPAGW